MSRVSSLKSWSLYTQKRSFFKNTQLQEGPLLEILIQLVWKMSACMAQFLKPSGDFYWRFRTARLGGNRPGRGLEVTWPRRRPLRPLIGPDLSGGCVGREAAALLTRPKSSEASALPRRYAGGDAGLHARRRGLASGGHSFRVRAVG